MMHNNATFTESSPHLCQGHCAGKCGRHAAEDSEAKSQFRGLQRKSKGHKACQGRDE